MAGYSAQHTVNHERPPQGEHARPRSGARTARQSSEMGCVVGLGELVLGVAEPGFAGSADADLLRHPLGDLDHDLGVLGEELLAFSRPWPSCSPS